MQRHTEIAEWVEGTTPAFFAARSDAMDELQGLEVGLNYLDRHNRIYEESTDSVEEAVGADEHIWPPMTFDRASNDLESDSFDELPETTPIFITYLRSLIPTGTGRTECASCSWQFDSDLGLDYIRSHFRDCYLKGLDMAEENVVEIEPQEITDKWRSCCSDDQADCERLQVYMPSIDGFVDQLRTLCNGRLVCIDPKCKAAQPFDAAVDNLRVHYQVYHDGRFLPHEDTGDLLDVTSHLALQAWKIERLFAKAQALSDKWVSMDNKARDMAKERCRWSLERECSAYGRFQEMQQFGVLKDLNKVFRSRYRQFHRLVSKSSSTDLALFTNGLREKYPKHKDLRRLGTRIFKRVLQGSSPTTLLEVFAFISLSQAMATVMKRRGIQVDLSPGTIDYHAWRACIEDEADQRLYDQILIAWFHPRWREELHSGGTNQTPFSVQEAMERLVLQVMQAKQTNGAFRFSAFLRLDSSLKKQAHQESTCTLRDDDHEPPGSPADTHTGKEAKDDPGGSGTGALINTIIFIGVWLFMIYISALGVALLYLGNPEHCHLITRDGEEHVASARNVVLAVEKMKDRIIDRLRRHPSITVLDGIVKGVDEVLDGGYVWSVSDLHICLEQAVQNHVEEPGLRSLLYTEIRRWCKEALNWVEPICERHRGGCMFVPVAL
ncbi:Hypothetical protein NCS54_01345500 [Fusarium falciforme]|uniref:Hypothetical protein n=1 Tax=Fusarium falciforme TaxID=195108 RepID=UPI0022FFD34E|nr:Hypothetical protein NCS54_01345500 [Fusarium falciforme]WAO95811.1 Hypothetical protein NCS54_01345500 [Fusarium falciforme]